MIKHICTAAALALACTAAYANDTQHHAAKRHHAAKHHVTQKHRAAMHNLRSDEAAIDRCASMRYGEKVNCLHQARGDHMTWTATGATFGSSAGGTGSGGTMGVRTPSQPNETQPGLSGSHNASGRM
jgi:hypothetical protein